MCTVLLPPGVNPIEVNKYTYHIISYAPRSVRKVTDWNLRTQSKVTSSKKKKLQVLQNKKAGLRGKSCVKRTKYGLRKLNNPPPPGL
jgi:hypothetical protein